MGRVRYKREFTTKIHFILDELIPPIIRDSRWFMWIPFKMVFGKKARIFESFKEDAALMSPREIRESYLRFADVLVDRETHLNQKSLRHIVTQAVGPKVVDIGCGRCHLSGLLSQKHRATGVDIIVDPQNRKRFKDIDFVSASVESLPFKNQAFDSVVCAHTLEHVQNLYASINELRRIAKRRLIIVIPRQRPYKRTFDPHLHFFPYKSTLMTLFGKPAGRSTCQLLDGDWFYMEEMD